jgi:hypothetical protein
MAWIARFIPVSGAELQRLQVDPLRLERALAGNAGAAITPSPDEPGQAGLLSLNDGVRHESSPVPVVGLSLGNWHGVHYLLCRRSETGPSAISHPVLGGSEFGRSYGRGRPRYFREGEVAALSRAIEKVDPEPIDWEEMNRLAIQPGDWSPVHRTRLLRDFERFREFYLQCRGSGHAVVTCLI